ncbi:MAG: PilZ domain-containing protein [Nitrospirota bacterium]
MNRRSDKRKHPRIPLAASATVLVGDQVIEITIGNVSMNGILFHAQHPFNLGAEIDVIFRGVDRGKDFEESVFGKIVTVSRKDSGNSYGLQFSDDLDKEVQPFLSGFVNRTKGTDISFLRNPIYSRAGRKP